MNARKIVERLAWTYDSAMNQHQSPPHGLRGRYIPEDSPDVAGYSKWSFFPGLSPRDQFADEASAIREIRAVYAGPDNWGIGLEI